MGMSRRIRRASSFPPPSAFPTGSEGYYELRQYNESIEDLLDNLIANPTEREGVYANTAVHCLVQEVIGAELDSLDVCRVKAAQIEMPIYPAFRIFAGGASSSYDTWFSHDWWVEKAAELRTMADHRNAGDPRIGLDMEMYGGTHEEPTLASMVASGRTYTQDQFFTAIQPFINALLEIGACVTCYPNVVGDADGITQFTVRMIQALGQDRVEVWWENTFGGAEALRKWPHGLSVPAAEAANGYHQLMREYFAEVQQFEAVLGVRGIRHRAVVDDDVYRVWGDPIRAAVAAGEWGNIYPWVFDATRADKASWGTPDSRKGITLYSANNVQYAWECPPGMNTPAQTSVGVATTPLTLDTHRSNVQSTSVLGPCCMVDLAGWRIVPGSQPTLETDIYGAFRVFALPANGSAAQDTWSVYVEFELPSTVTDDRPLFGQAWVNFGYHQFYYDASADEIRVQFSNGHDELVMASPPKDEAICALWSRSSATVWKCAFRVKNGTTITTTDISPGTTMPRSDLLLIGAGEEPASFHTNSQIQACERFVLKHLRVWHYALSVQEYADVLESVTSSGHTTSANPYPCGWFT